MTDRIDADLIRSWVQTALAALGEAREEIDALNVFPVPDGDTGTNMYLTMEAAELAMADADEQLPAEISDPIAEAEALAALSHALTRGALLGARGNSGVILSQVLRGMVHVEPIKGEELRTSADVIRRGFHNAAELAYAAVAEPKEGTMLTVIRKAAEAAQSVKGDVLADVVKAASAGAAKALAKTPEQLEVLKRAGVVDSGGRGIVVILDALTAVITGDRTYSAPKTGKVPQPELAPDSEGYDGPPFEVMFLFDGDDDRIPELKAELKALGDSLVVVGGDGLWNIHVHVTDAGAAIEAAMALGRPYRLRITWLATHDHQEPHEVQRRAVVCVSHGPGVTELLGELEVTSVPAKPTVAPSTGELLEAILSTNTQEVVVLPSDGNTKGAAEAAATSAQKQGIRAAVVPTKSIVQSLAALAVHDSGRRFDDDVVAMSQAAGAAHYGAVTVSSREVMTYAGPCKPGDILGIVGGEILEIGDDIGAVAQRTVDRLLSSGGELVTLVIGEDADPADVATLEEYLDDSYPGVETVVYQGGQPLWPMIIGVE